MSTASPWPTYAQLQDNEPRGTSWRVFGEDDHLGTANFLDATAVLRGIAAVRSGRTFNLDYPLNAFDPFPTGTRPPSTHTMFQNNPWHFDDWVDSYYLQSGSQIDALRHIGSPELGFYGGRSAADISTDPSVLGIDHVAKFGFAGRGVLLDVERYLATSGDPIDQSSAREITVADLDRTASAQGTVFADGDILLVRTGWADYCRQMSAEQRQHFAQDMRVPGLATTQETVAWLWDHHFSLVASDNLGVECYPYTAGNDITEPDQPPPPRGVDHNGGLHRPLLPQLGFLLGEMWALEQLADDCASDGVYEFLLTAKPLNLIGGAGSPANAIAIK